MNTVRIDVNGIGEVYPLLDKILSAGYKINKDFTWIYNNHYRSLFTANTESKNVEFRFTDPVVAMWFKLAL